MGALRRLNAHHVYALLLVLIGAVQAHLTDIQQYVQPKTFGLLTMGLGVAVAVLGFVRSQQN